MKRIQWIKTVSIAKILAFAVWVMISIITWLYLFEHVTQFTKEHLETAMNLSVLFAIIFYVWELRLTLKQKNNEIAVLKTRLNKYDK